MNNSYIKSIHRKLNFISANMQIKFVHILKTIRFLGNSFSVIILSSIRPMISMLYIKICDLN
jgi:hypothetical protein